MTLKPITAERLAAWFGADMTRRFILSCTKTGRWFRYASEGQCLQVALNLGWKDYEIEEEK